MSELISFLTENRILFRVIHLLALALGMGAAILADVFLIKFIRNSNIGQKEADILRTFSKVVWLGLILFLVSGAALTIPRLEIVQQSAKFQVKLIAVAIVFINGIMLNIFVTPKLIQIFGENISGKLRFSRKLAFAFGAISMTSWLTAFALGALRNLQISFLPLLGIFVGILIFNIVISQIVESILFNKKQPSPQKN